MGSVVFLCFVLSSVSSSSLSADLNLWSYYTANNTYKAKFWVGGDYASGSLKVVFDAGAEYEKRVFKKEGDFEPDIGVELSYEGIPVSLSVGRLFNPVNNDIGETVWRNYYQVPISTPFWVVKYVGSLYAFYLVEPDFLDGEGWGGVITYLNDKHLFSVSAGYMAGPDSAIFKVEKEFDSLFSDFMSLEIQAGANYGFIGQMELHRDEDSSIGEDVVNVNLDGYIVGYLGFSSTLKKLMGLSFEYGFAYYSFKNGDMSEIASASGFRNNIILSLPMKGVLKLPDFLRLTRWNVWGGWSGLFGRYKTDVWNHIFAGTTAEFFKILTFSVSHTVAIPGSGNVRHRFRVEVAVSKEFKIL